MMQYCLILLLRHLSRRRGAGRLTALLDLGYGIAAYLLFHLLEVSHDLGMKLGALLPYLGYLLLPYIGRRLYELLRYLVGFGKQLVKLI